MTEAAPTFRIFVSSTFTDLKAERDHLHSHVFPRLRSLCRQHGARFQPIDLRWGVSEEAGLDQQTMRICLGQIARCQKTTPRPNFIVLRRPVWLASAAGNGPCRGIQRHRESASRSGARGSSGNGIGATVMPFLPSMLCRHAREFTKNRKSGSPSSGGCTLFSVLRSNPFHEQ